ncbi:hypothetical protein [Streptomyces sp. NPDC046805]|uniref:hypothetical protein n=1 Tax=Streptomyces sp. NPDC046805 TaxID=3155134 RepID=UPI0033F7EB60
MRLATVLLLIAALFGVAPATAQAASAGESASHSVSYVALTSARVSSGIQARGHRRSRGGGFSFGRHRHGSSYTGRRKMPLWQAILFLLFLGCLVVWVAIKLVRKLRKVSGD